MMIELMLSIAYMLWCWFLVRHADKLYYVYCYVDDVDIDDADTDDDDDDDDDTYDDDDDDTYDDDDGDDDVILYIHLH